MENLSEVRIKTRRTLHRATHHVFRDASRGTLSAEEVIEPLLLDLWFRKITRSGTKDGHAVTVLQLEFVRRGAKAKKQVASPLN